MPRQHLRSRQAAALQEAVHPVKLKHHDALKILADERMDLIVDAINRFAGVTTYADAVHTVDTEPCYQVLCEDCGWTLDMICPECPGCGCHTDCTGWRHREYADEDSTGFYDEDEDAYYDMYDDEEDVEPREGPGAVPEEDIDLDDDLPLAQEEPDPWDWPKDREPSTGGWGGSSAVGSETPPL